MKNETFGSFFKILIGILVSKKPMKSSLEPKFPLVFQKVFCKPFTNQNQVQFDIDKFNGTLMDKKPMKFALESIFPFLFLKAFASVLGFLISFIFSNSIYFAVQKCKTQKKVQNKSKISPADVYFFLFQIHFVLQCKSAKRKTKCKIDF